MNEIQKKLLLDKIFEPQNFPALRKILKVGLSNRLDTMGCDLIYTLNFRIDNRELQQFRQINGEQYILSRDFDNLKRYVGGI